MFYSKMHIMGGGIVEIEGGGKGERKKTVKVGKVGGKVRGFLEMRRKKELDNTWDI